MIPSFPQVAVIDTFLGRCMSLHGSAREAEMVVPRDAAHKFAVVAVIVSVEVARPVTPGEDIQPRLF